MPQYQIVGECAHIPVDSPAGRVTQLMYRHAILPSGVDEKRIRHLLSVGLIAEIGVAEPQPAEPAGPGPDAAGGPGDPDGIGEADAATGGSETPAADGTDAGNTDEARAAARVKLPADGSAPGKAASKAVWVEYGVSKGYGYDDLKESTRDDLIATLTSV